jgi:hypothetical protein
MSISTKPQGPVENRLLAALPDEVLARLLPHLQPASFALGGVVYESSERMDRLYFPTTCIVSLLYTMTDGATAEMGLVGNDGIVGIALFMGGNTAPNRAMAQVAATPSACRRGFCLKSSGGAAPVNCCCCATRRR